MRTFELSQAEQTWLAEHPVIRVGLMASWPPFNYLDKQGVPSGIGADYITQLNRRLGGGLEVVAGDWHDLYKRVQGKQLDALLDLTPKPERQADFNFTSPYLDIPHVIIAQKYSPYLRDEEDLKGKVVALEKGFGNVDYFRSNYPEVLIKQYTSTSLALGAVARGEADAYVGNRAAALYIMGQEVMSNLKAHGRVNKEGSVLAIGVRKDWPMLVTILDRALSDIAPDEVRRIQHRWVGDMNSVRPIPLSAADRQWLSEHSTIRIAFDGNYPPYSFIDEQGEFRGIAVDIATGLARKLGVTLDVYPNGEWKRLYSAAQEGEVDIIATLVQRPGRENWFEFTRPYLSLNQYIILRQEELSGYPGWHALGGKTVALVEGYSTSELLMEQVEGIHPLYVATLAEALQAVAIGKAYATVADIGMANHIVTRSGLTNLVFAQLFSGSQSKQRFGVRKDWQQLAVILDKALESFSYQELMNIYSRWNMPNQVRPEAGFLSVIGELSEEERAWLDAHPQIRLASDARWQPFENIEGGVYSGIAADYIKLVERRLGIKFVQSPERPWSDIVKMVESRELDLFSCAMETEERRAYATFTKPYISTPMMIVTRDDIGYVDGLSGLKERVVAVERGYASHEMLAKDHPEIPLQPYADTLSALIAVSKGEAFAYVGNIAVASQQIRERGITNIKVSGQTLYDFDLGMGVRSDWPMLVSILQKALDSISLEERNAIFNKWVSIKVEERFDYGMMWKIITVAAVVVLSILYWNILLKRRVDERTEQLIHHAQYDRLTKLPNRFLLLDRVAGAILEARRTKGMFALLSLDLDDFKKVTDSLDYEVGDSILVEVGKRLRRVLREDDTVSRPGGDEFVILLPGLNEPSSGVPVAESLLNTFNKVFRVDGRDLLLTASIGIAVYPNDGDTSQELLRNASSAMHHSKAKGKNTVSFFTESMNRQVARRLQIEEQMHGALERGEMVPYYQPQVDVTQRNIIGFELLLRWSNPRLGDVPPDEFIPIAEQNGHIVPIGEFVLAQAVSASVELEKRYRRQFSIAVNVSPRQLHDENLLSKVQRLVRQSGVTPSTIEFEITEGVLMGGDANITATLRALKEIGIDIAMDDFGTGYSSMSYLRNYPFDTLKIDREFISDIESNPADRQLVNATVAMAHGLGLQVVAEGVETEEQLGQLVLTGCDQAQGYLFGRPMPFADLAALLEQR